jgi:hypothetical protein
MRDGVPLVRADQLPAPRFPREMAREERKPLGRLVRKDSRKRYWENRLEYDDEYAAGEREDDEESARTREYQYGHRPTGIKPQWARKARQIEDCLIGLIDKGVDLHRVSMYAPSLVWWYCTPESRSVEARFAAENHTRIAEMSGWENRGSSSWPLRHPGLV